MIILLGHPGRYLLIKTKLESMKLALLLLKRSSIGILLCWFFLTLYQVPVHAVTPRHEAEEILLEEAFQLIGQKYGVFFNYDQVMVNNINVNYNAEEHETLDAALEDVLGQADLKFQIFDKQYVAVYRDTEEGVESLKKMIVHFQGIVDKKELERKRKTNLVVPLSSFSTNELYYKRLILNVSGRVMDANGEPLIGVNVQVKGTNKGTASDIDGRFSFSDIDDQDVLVVSYIGYKTQEVSVIGQSSLTIVMQEDAQMLDEVIVVGYGTQKKSDITGSVASISKERLEMVPNLNIAQAIQGSIPGIQVQQTSSGSSPSQSIMIRGRNSIRASNTPLMVVDGIPYGGSLSDINPNDIESIEILKDASAAAIYGSRGSNGVILITSKKGIEGKPKIRYDGYYSFQDFANYPDYMDGNEYYDFKLMRYPEGMTDSEKRIYESKEWVDWTDLGTRTGKSQQHNLSVSGGSNSTKYYISGNFLDVKGLMINDDYSRITGRFNLDTKVTSWLTIGTQTQLAYDDKSGLGPNVSLLSRTNPLTRAYDEDGNLAIYIWEEDKQIRNPLQNTLFENTDQSHQITSNNYAVVNFPFVEGLSYRINTGIRFQSSDESLYIGRNTKDGLEARGSSETGRSRTTNTVIENIFSYQREIGLHNLFATGVYSYEKYQYSNQGLNSIGFPHDFISFYSSGQAELVTPNYSFNENVLMSQMLRFNYSYNSRYLMTLTGRRDGYSGFGTDNKWGIFPSVAFGWNVTNEDFFPANSIFNHLKPRVSYGVNGNQAVGAYESISRLVENNIVSAKQTLAGYIPSKLGQETLGWESSSTFNIGIDYGLMHDRFTGDINFFNTQTSDLLLNRSISSVHGINSIVQNIGETKNVGFEFAVNARNIIKNNFQWNTSANISFTTNEIVSLYGELDEFGSEIDDVGNEWFIGKPIRVNYDFVWDGTWQTSETEQAAKWGSQPGFVKLKDVNNDGELNADDRQIIGQSDPKLLWGMTNSFSYKNFKLNIFIHGVHGVTKQNDLMSDYVNADVRLNTTNKNWWTPENPTNKWVVNHLNAEWMSGIRGYVYENADFVRVKDVSLSYDFTDLGMKGFNFDQVRLFFTARNLYTITKWRGLDPELSSQRQAPLQREFVMGINFGL